ncbi:ATP-binding protein [Pseudomonas sp. TTU2014-080ASC]|uniref:ATP-binding protein n=1 Tax=Pseudomonas sp. TTU2014-080ASC TaxID=1729724 RepID=UPI000718848F|nr:ATP-binding protein [Pseudomonas sp. TTU2014-080ASC]KRW59799.1 histidine kinase [Pseudomonas sp. TTU2014-080ASC]
MKLKRSWSIHTHTQLISLGPALVVTLLLCAFFAITSLHDLRQERNQNGQQVASHLAHASTFALAANDQDMLEVLFQGALQSSPHIRFLELRSNQGKLLVYSEQPTVSTSHNNKEVEVFRAKAYTPQIHGTLPLPLGQIIVGIANDNFTSRQREILLKAALLALLALLPTFFLARRLARRLSKPLSEMGQAVTAIQAGNFHTPLPEVGNGELASLSRHINDLALALSFASQEQQRAMGLLIQAREQAVLANQTKSDFLAMMSHELRTPMNGVLGMLQLMETTEMTSEQHEYAALAKESTEHLLKVINDMLDFSRIERGGLELERITFNIAELLNNALHLFRHSASQRGLLLRLELSEGLDDILVQGDPTRLRQILINLIGNALKFTESGSIGVHCSVQTLDHQVLWLTCEVHDSGIGIPPESLEKMFDPFRQADTSISRRYGGTGLGLPIARSLAERMGGTLNARSTEGQGSVFTLELPLLLAATGPEPTTVPHVPASVHDHQPVLLIEENTSTQAITESLIRSLGYPVYVARSNAEAVHLLAQQAFAIILLECSANTDYQETLLQIRQQISGSAIPVIAMASNTLLQQDQQLYIHAGIHGFLPRPFKLTDLQQLLEYWLQSEPLSGGQLFSTTAG